MFKILINNLLNDIDFMSFNKVCFMILCQYIFQTSSKFKKVVLMSYLFLTASFTDVKDKFKKFYSQKFDDKLQGKTVTFIPTACIPEDYKEYMTNDKKAFESLGLRIDELDISFASLPEITEKIQKNDFIFVGGGNTFFLLQEMQKSGANKVISEAIKQSKLYIGTSAGSVILAPTIDYVEKMDEKVKAPQLKSTQGLNLITFYPLPHYDNEPFKKQAHEIFKAFNSSLNLVKFNNDEAVIVENGVFKLV